MTQQEAYKILGITEEEIEAAGAVPEGTEAAGASTETSQSFDNAFQNFNRQAVERLIKKKYRQRILNAHPDVQPEEETEYSAQQLNYAYAYLKKNGWHDGHVSKKSYQVKSRASKTQVWDAPVNLRAWREREIYSYAEDSEGEKIGYFKIAAGKYIWKTEEDFSLFQKSIFACASQILEEVERKKQIYKSERLRIQTLAALVYLLAQQFLNSTALLKELGQEQKADAEGNRIFLIPAMLELTGNIQAAEGEVISPKRLTMRKMGRCCISCGCRGHILPGRRAESCRSIVFSRTGKMKSCAFMKRMGIPSDKPRWKSIGRAKTADGRAVGQSAIASVGCARKGSM